MQMLVRFSSQAWQRTVQGSTTLVKLSTGFFLLLLSEEVGGLEDIRRFSASVDYADYIGRGQSFAVRADRVGVHPFTSLDIAASVGQAVIESFQTATGVRLKVDLSNPDVEIYALLRDSEFLLGVNTTGVSLHPPLL
jgi:23S rRNA G2445 N2-methylase RlmL